MLAVVPVRAGALPAGALETVAEAGGRVLVAGDGAGDAGDALSSPRLVREVLVWECPGYSPGAWAYALAPALREEPCVVLPASADGRDLAPRLAHELGRPLVAGALSVTPQAASVARRGGLVVEDVHMDGPFVATLQPGVRGIDVSSPTGSTGSGPAAEMSRLDLVARRFAGESPGPDAQVLEVLPPDVTTLDLAEARRIVGGGAGLDSEERFVQLQAIATAIGASLGATRVVTDRHWLSHDRQIGTTGVVVDPALYLAFGISGAVQHTSGLGQPDHIISVNTDAFCPMMQLADLAIVADANAVLDELAVLLGLGDDVRDDRLEVTDG